MSLSPPASKPPSANEGIKAGDYCRRAVPPKNASPLHSVETPLETAEV